MADQLIRLDVIRQALGAQPFDPHFRVSPVASRLFCEFASTDAVELCATHDNAIYSPVPQQTCRFVQGFHADIRVDVVCPRDYNDVRIRPQISAWADEVSPKRDEPDIPAEPSAANSQDQAGGDTQLRPAAHSSRSRGRHCLGLYEPPQ